MIVSINRDGVCMGDDAMDHRREITLTDNATGRDLLEKLQEIHYLPDQTGAVWYTGSLNAKCVVAWSCKKKKIIAELKDVPLVQIDGDKTWYDFRYAWSKDGLNILKDAIRNTPSIWYDKDFFGGHL